VKISLELNNGADIINSTMKLQYPVLIILLNTAHTVIIQLQYSSPCQQYVCHALYKVVNINCCQGYWNNNKTLLKTEIVILCIKGLKCNFFSPRETFVARWLNRGRQFPEGEKAL
jgi:hypothetical protein